MFLLDNYWVAVGFCVVTMLCWGSWANTQKLAGKSWRYELYYWDYVFGVLIASLAFAFTLGSNGQYGRSFVQDLQQADLHTVYYAFFGGVVFNIANILLVAAIAIAGMSVAFPVGIGLALVLGVLWNYLASPADSGNPVLLFLGVGFVSLAIIVNAIAYRTLPGGQGNVGARGLILSVLCGVLMSTFYFLVQMSLAGVIPSPEVIAQEGWLPTKILPLTLETVKLGALQSGRLTPYTANVIFAVGILVSNCVVMPILMKRPISGEPVKYFDYFCGRFTDHLCGLVGGLIWALGMTFNVIASGVASSAVAYGLGQGATLMSAIWGVFIWREFRDAPRHATIKLYWMFVFFVLGLSLIIITKL
ncbi:MAG: multidrug DMT transporter permease [Planctomycetia bacterium]|nr:multidrug DMT transporter permease [Planctomycetia bacterium]